MTMNVNCMLAELFGLIFQEVAMLEFSDFYEVGNLDYHRDMRLDIEDMSYEVS